MPLHDGAVILVPPDCYRDLSSHWSCLKIHREGCEGWEDPSTSQLDMLSELLAHLDSCTRPRQWISFGNSRVGINDVGVYIHRDHHKRFFGVPRVNASVSLRLAVPEAVPFFSPVEDEHSLISKLKIKMPTITDEMRHRVLYATFVTADLNRNGVLSRAELGKMMRRVICFMRAHDAEELLEQADRNGDHKVQYAEFAEWLKKCASEKVISALRRSLATGLDVVKASFRVWDISGDGLISKKEITEAMKKLYRKQKISEGQIIALTSTMDTDHNGKIDYDEFVTFLFSGLTQARELSAG